MSSPSETKQLKVPSVRDTKRISSPGSDQRKVSTPSLPSKSDSKGSEKSKSINQLPPRITRSRLTSTSNKDNMSLSGFIAASDRLSLFEEKINTPSTTAVTLSTLKVRQKQVCTLWERIEREYELCVEALSSASSNDDFSSLQTKYSHCYNVYERCWASLNDQIEAAALLVGQSTQSSSTIPASRGLSLPPCDTEVFSGDYMQWPTFRDLFKAIYVNNTRLTPVEKLFHLNAKTTGEAKAIVANSPLTNQGFATAWAALQDRYENKRLLVNSQLKILFNLSPVTVESGPALKELQSTIQGCLTAFKNSEISTENWDNQLVYLCTGKLPDLTLSLWEQSLPDKAALPTWQALNTFLSERYRTLEVVEDVKQTSNVQLVRSVRNNPPSKKLNNFETKVNAQTQTCKVCSKENHPIRVCPRFLQMTIKERSNCIRQQKLCLNCFARGHQLRECTSAHNCYKCKGRHNTLLHRDDTPPAPSAAVSPFDKNIQSTSAPNLQNYFASGAQSVLLGTALVHILHNGTTYTARALIDSGSEGTFISERLFKTLKIPYQRIQAHVSGLNQATAGQAQKLCQFSLVSPQRPRMQIETSAYVLPHLAENLPSCSVPSNVLRDLPDIPLADPSFSQSSQIDVLIGADILPSILLGGFRPNICGTLLGQETVFGWVITGPVPSHTTNSIASFSTRISVDENDPLEKLLTSFWEVEDLPARPAKESDTKCEEFFVQTTRRQESGRYVVLLPFRNPEQVTLGHSRSIAMAQFLKNENRLKRNPHLKSQYDAVIQEYLDLGHMRQVTADSGSQNFYLPHHAVFKPDSTTTQVRVVFNASSKSTNGVSLNDVLHPGPVLQSDLTIQLLKWRCFRFVFNADITKMYRQILVDPQHTSYQRILFRDHNGQLNDYELNTVTFGVNCAPFLALRVLQQLALDVEAQYPLASEIVKTFMYVDDVLAGSHSEETAISMIRELRAALDTAGFPLRKWTSNEKSLLKAVPVEHLLNSEFLEIEDASIAKTLGIRWRATSDRFYFNASEPVSKSSYTKREVLSQIAKLFDPAGWLAPFIVQAKMFMQEIWLRELSWDDDLPNDLCVTWQSFLHSFVAINQIQIPRWLQVCPSARVQIHGFCDASQRAYGAAIYVRVELPQGVFCNLLTAKTRVAPVKTVSLPRLELCGAVLLAELSAAIVPKLPISHDELFFWTDSTIVLAWLNRPPCNWNTFVANRVSKIARSGSIDRWRHVRSEENPADLASRGISAIDLVNNDMWWHGPEWLRSLHHSWQVSEIPPPETDIEQRPVKVHAVMQTPPDILVRFSDLGRALRVLAYALRFIKSCRKLEISSSKELSGTELNNALERVTISTQRVHYSDEHRCLRNKKSLPSSSSILNLNPFIDNNGVIRACGRVQASDSMTYNERYPVLLPATSPLVRLLVRFTHHISLHGGNQLVVRLIRAKYWIPKLRNVVKAVIHSCKVCVIHRKKVQSQLMGDLPSERVTYSRPFTYTGVDFAGPFEIKSFTGRACRITKGYVCVFVCFTTKAIHLEATSDLSTDTFLAAFARFIARRGCPLQIHSDNGKNFVGASRTLANEFLEATKTQVTVAYSHQHLSWRFIPPGAPHMGGLWEAGVKSFKTLFHKSMSTTKYTHEEFATLLSKIEACLNSRPISPMSEDPTDSLALSPGHFLVGGPLLSIAEPEIKESASSILNRWQRLKALNQQFCSRWKVEYLRELHKRNKWRYPTKNLEVGDLVVIKEDNIPSHEWRMGRVHKTYPGTDSRVRVVDLLTTRGLIKRPLTKVVLLPKETELLSSYAYISSDQ